MFREECLIRYLKILLYECSLFLNMRIIVDNEKKDAVLTELRAKLAYRNIQFAAQCAHLDRLSKALHVMKMSSSWRLTKPLRKLVDMAHGKY